VAQHVFEKPGGFSVYWAVMDDSPIKTIADLKGKTVGISVIGGGTQGPFNLLLKQNGVDPAKDIKLVEVGFAVSEDALRQGRVDAVNMNQPFAARAEAKGGTRKLFSLSQAMPNIVHILEACRADFVDKNPELVKAYVRDITSGMKKALANREETLKVVNEVLKAPIPVLETYLLKDNDFGRDPVRCPRQLILQPQEALIALELRVRLGHGDEPSERAVHLRVRIGHLLRVLALDGVDQATARTRDLAEHRELLIRHPLHRRDEVGDQLRTALELDLDLALRRIRLLVELLDRVVPARAEREREEKCEPPTFHGSRSWEG
jgi:hypothetical protein